MEAVLFFIPNSNLFSKKILPILGIWSFGRGSSCIVEKIPQLFYKSRIHSNFSQPIKHHGEAGLRQQRIHTRGKGNNIDK